MFKSYKTKIVASILAVATLAIAGIAYANPSYFGPTSQTSTSTTTPAYLVAATAATSTVTLDTYSPTSKLPNITAKQVALGLRFTGSSTSAVLGVNLEYSQDGIDWYSNAIVSTFTNSTTTQSIDLSVRNAYKWTYAAETVGGVAGTVATSTRMLIVPVPVRYVRAVISVTGANGAIWAQFIPTKEL